MIKCQIILEEVTKGKLSVAIIPEGKPTALEAKAWRVFDELFGEITEGFMRKFGGSQSSLLSGTPAIRALVEERLKNLDKLKSQREFVPSIVHFMREGQAACRREGLPKDWPVNEFWSGKWEEVNCPECRAAKWK